MESQLMEADRHGSNGNGNAAPARGGRVAGVSGGQDGMDAEEVDLSDAMWGKLRKKAMILKQQRGWGQTVMASRFSVRCSQLVKWLSGQRCDTTDLITAKLQTRESLRVILDRAVAMEAEAEAERRQQRKHKQAGGGGGWGCQFS